MTDAPALGYHSGSTRERLAYCRLAHVKTITGATDKIELQPMTAHDTAQELHASRRGRLSVAALKPIALIALL